MKRTTLSLLLTLSFAGASGTQTTYDLLIKGGHVIDPKNGIDAVRDVAIKGARSPPSPRTSRGPGAKTVNAAGLHVTPGLLDSARPRDTTVSDPSMPTSPTACPWTPSRCEAARPRWPTRAARAGATSTTSSADRRHVEDARHGVPEHRRPRQWLAAPSSRTWPTWRPRPTAGDGAQAQGPGSSASRAPTSTDPSGHPFTRAVEAGTIANVPVMVDFGSAQGADHRGAVRPGLPSGRHLHARLRRRGPRGGHRRQGQPGQLHGAKEGHRLRHRPRRRELRLPHGHAGHEGRLLSPTRSRPTCTSAA